MQTDAKTWNYCELICIKFKFLTRICISNNWNFIQRKYIAQCRNDRKPSPPPPQLQQFCTDADRCQTGCNVICNPANYYRFANGSSKLNPDLLLTIKCGLSLKYSGWSFNPGSIFWSGVHYIQNKVFKELVSAVLALLKFNTPLHSDIFV